MITPTGKLFFYFQWWFPWLVLFVPLRIHHALVSYVLPYYCTKVRSNGYYMFSALFYKQLAYNLYFGLLGKTAYHFSSQTSLSEKYFLIEWESMVYHVIVLDRHDLLFMMLIATIGKLGKKILCSWHSCLDIYWIELVCFMSVPFYGNCWFLSFNAGSVYSGVDFCKRLCGVSIIRRYSVYSKEEITWEMIKYWHPCIKLLSKRYS